MSSGAARVIPIAIILALLVFAWFSIRFQIGDMIGEFTLPSESRAEEMASVAISLAPTDPKGYRLAGAQIRASFDAKNTAASISYLTAAARRAPFAYGSWLDLGRANEQEGRLDEAELALKRAVELAPAYAIPHWHLGNFYLRRNRTEDSIPELRAAARFGSVYRSQVFGIAWRFFGEDPAKVEEFVPTGPDARADLAAFYASLGRGDDAVRVWNNLTNEQKVQFRWMQARIQKDLSAGHSYRAALEFARQSGTNPSTRVGAVTNGGFELPVYEGLTSGFDWLMARDSGRIDIGPDRSVKHSGEQSLKFVFRTFKRPGLSSLAQHIAVDPGKNYELKFWVRTEELKSGGLPYLSVVNSTTGKAIANSKAFSIGTSDWAQLAISFRVPQDTDGIFLTTAREYCGDTCPIVGTFWLDDVELRAVE